jgi:predicted PurR-regulated permease PerM
MVVTDSQKWLILASTVVVGWLIVLLAPVLTPFLISALLAYLGDPIVDRLEARGVSRTVSVVLVFLAMFIIGLSAVLVIIPALQSQATILLQRIPTALEWLQSNLLPKLSSLMGGAAIEIDIPAVKETLLSHWQDVGSVAKNLMAHIGRSSQLLIGWVTYLLLIPVVTFYLLRDWDLLVAEIHDLLPRTVERRITALAKEIDDVLAEFLRGQLTVMACLAVVYVIGLWIIGLDLAFVVGMLAGLVSFVPYLGVIVGLVLAGFAALVQFPDWLHLLGVALIFGLGQVLEGMVLSPLLVGDRIGLHPVAVIFAVMAGGQLFGFLGVLLALPVAAIIVVLLRHSKKEYQSSDLYGS